jgi:hypothetical protein
MEDTRLIAAYLHQQPASTGEAQRRRRTIAASLTTAVEPARSQVNAHATIVRFGSVITSDRLH